jgi:glycerol dehydrogenase
MGRKKKTGSLQTPGELQSRSIERVAARATAEGETIHNEPFEVRPDMATDAIRAAAALGRDWKNAHGDEGPK